MCGGGNDGRTNERKKMIKNLYLKCIREKKRNSPESFFFPFSFLPNGIKQGNLCCVNGKGQCPLAYTQHTSSRQVPSASAK